MVLLARTMAAAICKQRRYGRRRVGIPDGLVEVTDRQYRVGTLGRRSSGFCPFSFAPRRLIAEDGCVDRSGARYIEVVGDLGSRFASVCQPDSGSDLAACECCTSTAEVLLAARRLATESRTRSRLTSSSICESAAMTANVLELIGVAVSTSRHQGSAGDARCSGCAVG